MAKKLNKLPVYNMIMDESDSESGVEFISLVEHPAIEINWVAMSDAKNKYEILMAAAKDQQMLYGPFMVPDLPIYRNDATHGEYYVVFSKEEIKKISRKFMKEGKTINLNYQHEDDSQISAVIEETWFVAAKNDKSKDFGFELPEGTWFGGVHVESEDFWKDEVKTGKVKGFSIQGWLDLQMSKQINKMSKVKFAEIKDANGCTYFLDGEIAVDTFIYSAQPQVILIDGKQSVMQYPVWDTIIETPEGQILTIKDGKILEITQKESTPETQNKEEKMTKQKFAVNAKTKDGKILSTSAESWAVGSDAWIISEDESVDPVTAPDADYELEDGTIVTVASGVVTAIVPIEAEAKDEKKDEEKMEIAPEVLTLVEDLKKTITDLTSRVETLEKANTEMNALFSKIPGAPAGVVHSDKPKQFNRAEKEATMFDELASYIKVIKK